jgi:hypothetical protein
MGLQHPDPDPPDIEEAVAPGLEQQKDEQHETDDRQRSGASVRLGVDDGKDDAGGHHCPVGGGIEPHSPDLAAIELASVKMGERADIGARVMGLVRCFPGVLVGLHVLPRSWC